MRLLQTIKEWPWGHVCDLLLTELLEHKVFNHHIHSAGLEVGVRPGPRPLLCRALFPRHTRHPGSVSSHPLTLMVSSSMRRRLFSDRRSLFLVSICCSCVSNSASYSRLPSWNSRSSSCVFSALQQNSQMSDNNILSTYMLPSLIHGSALYSTTFWGRNYHFPHFTDEKIRFRQDEWFVSRSHKKPETELTPESRHAWCQSHFLTNSLFTHSSNIYFWAQHVVNIISIVNPLQIYL